MTSPNKTKLLQQANHKNLTLRPAPVTRTFQDTEIVQDKAGQESDMENSTRSAANGASLGGGNNHEHGRLPGPSGKGKQNGTVENENSEVSSLAPAAFQNDTAEEVDVPGPGPLSATNDNVYTLPPHEEFRDAWHNCDGCGNIIRCSFRTPQIRNEDGELYGDWNGHTNYDATIVPPGQGWNVPWDAAPPPTEAGDGVEAPSATTEEEPLYLLVKYGSHPCPDPSGSGIAGKRDASYTIVSGILPSDPYPAIMAKILHRLKAIDGTHNPYLIAPTAQIDYVDIQFGAMVAHALGSLGRRRIEDDYVRELLTYLRQSAGEDDILEVFLVAEKGFVDKNCEAMRTVERINDIAAGRNSERPGSSVGESG